MQSIGSSKFAASSKFANVTLVFEQGSGNLRENKRPISFCGQLLNHFDNILAKLRGNHRRYSVRKSVLGNFTKFTGIHLCKSIFLNKIGS